MAKKKTGLGEGIEAFFPKETTEPPPTKSRRVRRTGSEDSKKKALVGESNLPRRTAWIREDHLERLELLKLKERRRLKGEGKRASITALIDEALELYLANNE